MASMVSNNRKKKGLRLSEGDDWDCILDDSCTNISFLSTAITAARSNSNVGYHTPSPDQSSDDDSGIVSSLFDNESLNH